ncbi:hypothetical protein C1646_676688 [Rhizophagus diaphanus]|nr:hypothetical protein C1646_676688 [Rhizophagus diaphanus] [Rhizophagus sp. MUCL 43196]
MDLVTSYYNDPDTFKNINASLLNSITFNKKELTEINMGQELRLKYQNQNKVGEYDECLSNLKKILSELKISLEEFELLFRLKNESNLEFHQDKIKTLDEAKKDLETDFSDDLKEFKNPLRKLINALESW